MEQMAGRLVSNCLKNLACSASVWLPPCADVTYVRGEMEDRAVILFPGSCEQGVMKQRPIT